MSRDGDQFSLPGVAHNDAPSKSWQERKLAAQKIRVDERKRLGLCTWGYCPHQSVAGTVLCEKHRDHTNERNRRYKLTRPEGTCRDCNNPAAPPKKLCVRCQRGRKNNHLIRLYGISLESFEAVYDKSGRKCMICGVSFAGISAAKVDHEHSTGIIRGLLCNRCNVGVGMFCDSIGNLRLAIKYLEQTEQVRARLDKACSP